MKQFSRIMLVLSTLVCLGSAYADSEDSRTFLGPTLRLGYTAPINTDMAYSIAGEASPKNLRVGGTMGWLLSPYQRVKISAEYLWQDITYSFFSGDTNQWVNQGAIGAAYQYDFGCEFSPQFDLKAYASHANNKSLSTTTQSFINADGSVTTYVVDRHIAGSNAAGIAPGFTFVPWFGSNFSILLNYDWLRYDKSFSDDETVSGLGGTAIYNQALTKRIGFGLGAEVRRPFNNYTANLNYTTLPDNGNWVISIFGNYLDGKQSLPNTWNLGLNANYLLDNQPCAAAVLNHHRDLKGEVAVPIVRNNLVAWTADPAVYMPQVLAVPEQKVNNLCNTLTPIVLLSPLPDFIGPNFIGDLDQHVFNSPTHFSGTGVTYSLTGTVVFSAPVNPIPASSVFFIDSQTGAITLPANTIISDTEYELTITASNGCTSTTGVFLVEIDNT